MCQLFRKRSAKILSSLKIARLTWRGGRFDRPPAKMFTARTAFQFQLSIQIMVSQYKAYEHGS